MKKIYYVIETSDGCPYSRDLSTLKEARREKKYLIKQDKEEFGLNEGDIGYHIVKYEETEDTVYYTEID